MFFEDCHPWPHFMMAGRRRRRGDPPEPPCPPFPPHPPHHGHHGHHPPWLFELFGGRQGRASRGEVRYLILDAIREQPRHGYEVIQTIEARTGGAYKPSPGTVYPTLQLLEEMGHARSREEEGRKVYEITEEGLADLEAHEEDVEDAYERFEARYEWLEGAELRDLVKRVKRMMRVIGKSFRRGRLSKKQTLEVKAAIEEAVQRIEQALRDRG